MTQHLLDPDVMIFQNQKKSSIPKISQQNITFISYVKKLETINTNQNHLFTKF